MNKDEAKKELEFYKNLAINHEAIVKGCNEKIIELQAIINKPARWQDGLVQPDKEAYFYISDDNFFGLCTVSERFYGSKRKPEYAFKTIEQAELIKEKMLLMQEMHAFAHVKNCDWVADWDDSSQRKYGIILCENKAHVDHFIRMNQLVFGVAVKSKEIAEEMLEIFGERIEKFYNKMY